MRPVAADAVITRGGEVLLIKRKIPPFNGSWVFPGGKLEGSESLEQTLEREVREETSLEVEKISQIGTYSSYQRDPRHIISTAFLCFTDGTPKSSGEGFPRWFPYHKALSIDLGFDHSEILRDALNLLVHFFIDSLLSLAWKKRAPVLFINKGNNDFWKLVFIMLSARTRDEATAKALQRLQSRFSSPEELASSSLKELETLLRGVGFYKQKSQKLRGLAKSVAKHGVPKEKEALTALPGVGPKTANVFLAEVHGKPVIGVDTHVHRISNRIGLVNTKNPQQTEKALNFLSEDNKKRLNLAFVAHGQTTCKPVAPKCEECPISKFCAYSFKNKTGFWKRGIKVLKPLS